MMLMRLIILVCRYNYKEDKKNEKILVSYGYSPRLVPYLWMRGRENVGRDNAEVDATMRMLMLKWA